MRHNILRRLSALALALVMTASLCVSPARAEIPGVSMDKLVIILENIGESDHLNVLNVPEGYNVSWQSENKNIIDVTPDEKDSSKATVTYKSGTANELEIDATVSDSSGNMQRLTCYVYGGVFPFDAPLGTTLPSVSVRGDPHTESINIINVSSNNQELLKYLLDNISFKSKDPSVATVTKTTSSPTAYMTITGVKAGKTTIEMTIGGYTRTWDLTVNPSGYIEVDSVTVSPTEITLTASNPTAQMTAYVLPTYATWLEKNKVEWVSTKPDIAKVDENGLVTRVTTGTGETWVYALADGKASNNICVVTVEEANSDMTLKLNPAGMTLDFRAGKGGATTGTITAELTGKGHGSAKVTWSSSNENIAKLSSKTGTFVRITSEGKTAGTATITAVATFTYTDSKTNRTTTTTVTKTCTVTVINDTSSVVTGITLDKTVLSMQENETATLTATVSPSSAPDKTLEWSNAPVNNSKGQQIIELKDGKITAKNPGQTLVTVKARYGASGTEAVCVVTVAPAATAIRFTFPKVTPTPVAGTNDFTYTFKNLNENFTVNAILEPSDKNNPPIDPIHWSSEYPSVATVTNAAGASTTGTNATITAVSPGKTKISAVPMDANGKDRALVNAAEITVTVSGLTITNEDGNTLSALTLMKERRQTVLSRAWGDANTGNNSVDWTTSDPSIVSISTKSGESTVLTARAPGTATITIRKGTFITPLQVTVIEDSAGLIEATTPASTAYQFSKLASQLASACSAKTGSSLSYITNLSVSSTDQGTLYDQHYSSDDTGAGVGIQARYYYGTAPQGQRSLNDLSFVPKNTFTGTAEISYTAWSTNNKSFPGVIRITVNGTGDVAYSSGDGSPVTFSAEDFNFYHPNLKSVSFTLPSERQGILYYNYTNESHPGTRVAASDTYNRTSSPSLDRVTFVPAAGYSGTVSIGYKGTNTSGRSFTGTVTITVVKPAEGSSSGSTGGTYYPQNDKLSYSVAIGKTVGLLADDFNDFCVSITGASLSCIEFDELPTVSQGTLRYTKANNSTPYSVGTGTRFFYAGSGTTAELLENVYFQAGSSIETATVPFTGYDTNGKSFTGKITIKITPPTTNLKGTNSSPFRLTADQIRSAVSGSLSGTLSYIIFTELPSTSAGRLYSGYNGFGTGTQVSVGTRYYASGSPGIDQLSFVPKGRYNGQLTIPYTATNTDGKNVNGQLVFDISSSGNSKHFKDMANHPWAGPSVDYLYENGVAKGITTTAYGPNQNIKRGDFVLMLVRALKLTGSGSYSFPDVPTREYFAGAVATAKQQGIVNGDNGYFRPYDSITRQDAMVIIKNALAASGRNLSSASGSVLDRFPDGSSVSSYARDAVSTLVQLGAVTGNNGYLLPYNPITRAEAAVILHFVMTM